MLIFWGPEHFCFYNDAFLPSLGAEKHPSAMGMRGEDVWSETWSITAPQLRNALEFNKASWNVDQLLPVFRNGRIEEGYWTYSHSPIFGEDGHAEAVLVTISETTSRVLQLRRQNTLQNLIEELGHARYTGDSLEAAIRSFRQNPTDIQFALIYLLDETERYILRATLGFESESRLRASVDAIQADPEVATLIQEASLNRKDAVLFKDAKTVFPYLEGAPWNDDHRAVYGTAVTTSLNSRRVTGFILYGLSPQLPFDSAYQRFLKQLTAHFSVGYQSAADQSEIQARERYFRTLLDASPAKIWITDQKGKCTYISRQWFTYTGHSELEDLGTGWLANIHPDDRALTERSFREGHRTHKAYGMDYRLKRFDGVYRWMSDRAEPRFDEEGCYLGFIGSITDIHARKTAEEKLRLGQARFERVLRVNEIGIWHGAIPLKDLNWDDRVKMQFWVLPGTNQISFDLFLERVHPDDRDRVVREIREATEEGAPYDTEYRVLNPDTGEIRWIHALGTVIQEGSESGARFEGLTADITPQKNTEDALANAVRTRDEFFSIASHELRTPITSLRLQLQLVQRKIHQGKSAPIDPQMLARVLDISTRQVDRLSRLIDDLLDVSKMTAGKMQFQFERSNISELFVDVISRFEDQFSEAGYSIQLDVQPGIEINADSYRIDQLITNLITNAIKYGGGKPLGFELKKRGDWVQIEVCDHGMGITPENRDKIFERFERANQRSKITGLGLGLYISKQIVEAHGGSIWVESEFGKGSTFYVRLPYSEQLSNRSAK